MPLSHSHSPSDTRVVRPDLGRDRDQDLLLAQWKHSASRLQHQTPSRTRAFHALSVCTAFGVFYNSRNYAAPAFRAVMAIMPFYSFSLQRRFTGNLDDHDRAGAQALVIIRLARCTRLACPSHWPEPEAGVIPLARNSPWKAACPMTVTVGSQASNSPAGPALP